eukprot:9497506-Pyramimonas_sp.AAC.2
MLLACLPPTSRCVNSDALVLIRWNQHNLACQEDSDVALTCYLQRGKPSARTISTTSHKGVCTAPGIRAYWCASGCQKILPMFCFKRKA